MSDVFTPQGWVSEKAARLQAQHPTRHQPAARNGRVRISAWVEREVADKIDMAAVIDGDAWRECQALAMRVAMPSKPASSLFTSP